jgi:uncharacterized membrane protein
MFATQGFRQKQHTLIAFQVFHILVPFVPFYKGSVPTSVPHYVTAVMSYGIFEIVGSLLLALACGRAKLRSIWLNAHL